jgi:hypothetical protein
MAAVIMTSWNKTGLDVSAERQRIPKDIAKKKSENNIFYPEGTHLLRYQINNGTGYYKYVLVISHW